MQNKYIDYLSKKYTWNKKQRKQMLRSCNKKRQNKNVELGNHTWADIKLRKGPNKYLQTYLPWTSPNTSKSTEHSVFPAALTAIFVYIATNERQCVRHVPEHRLSWCCELIWIYEMFHKSKTQGRLGPDYMANFSPGWKRSASMRIYCVFAPQ